MSYKKMIAIAALASAATTVPTPAQAFEPLLGQMMTVGFNFCPRGWALADGQILPINSNQALFSLLGTTYGGDGRTTFGLPDLRGRNSVHVGNGPGLPSVTWGQRAGSTNFTLLTANMPAHNHTAGIQVHDGAGDSNVARSNALANAASGTPYSDAGTSSNKFMANGSVLTQNTGGSQSVNKRSPMLGMYHCIATQGIFPSRN